MIAGVDLQLAAARPQRERLFREEVNIISGSGSGCRGGWLTTCSSRELFTLPTAIFGGRYFITKARARWFKSDFGSE